jgi:hypothetical protein
MKRTGLYLVVTLLLFVTLACSFLPGGGGGGEVQITIENESAEDVCYVLISPTDSESWGDDRLGSDEIIESGESYTFDLEEDSWDVQLMNCDEAVLATAWEIDSDTTVTVGGPNQPSIELINNTNVDVCYVYIDPSDEDEWTEDWLGMAEVILPGDSRYFFVEPGTYDMQAQDCEQQVLTEEFGVEVNEDIYWELTGDVQGGTEEGGAMGGSVALSVDNQSPYDICYVYISPTVSDNWGEDWLGADDTIVSGDVRDFYVEPGTYDLLVQDCDGADLVQEVGVNLTEDASWTISD